MYRAHGELWGSNRGKGECSSLTKHIYDVSRMNVPVPDLKSLGLGREERKMEIALLLSDFLDRTRGCAAEAFILLTERQIYATRKRMHWMRTFRYWTGKEDEKGFSVLPAHMDDYFRIPNQAIYLRRSSRISPP